MSHQEYQRNPPLRKKFYKDYLMMHNSVTEVTWNRTDAKKYIINDYVNEQSKVKFWKCGKEIGDQD